MYYLLPVFLFIYSFNVEAETSKNTKETPALVNPKPALTNFKMKSGHYTLSYLSNNNGPVITSSEERCMKDFDTVLGDIKGFLKITKEGECNLPEKAINIENQGEKLSWDFWCENQSIKQVGEINFKQDGYEGKNRFVIVDRSGKEQDVVVEETYTAKFVRESCDAPPPAGK